MIICMPIESNEEMKSPLSDHFGSAPLFAIVDTDTQQFRVAENNNEHHGHGGCAPVALLADMGIQALIVRGIGAGAIRKFSAMGVDVLSSPHATVAEAVAAHTAGKLVPLAPGDAFSQGHLHHH